VAVHDGDAWTSTIDSAEAQEGIEFYTGLATEHGLSSPAATTWDETDLSDAFTRGDVAMMIAGSWTPAALVEGNPDLEGKIGAFPIPGPDGGLSPSFLGGSHLSIFNTAENPDLAFALLRLMGTGEFADKWGQQSGYFPGTNTLLEEVQSEGDPLVAPFAQQVSEAGKSVPVTPLYGQIQGKKTVSAMLQSILSGDSSVADASAAAADEMDEIFSRGN
jgi:N,N'-diacetylchitobiose transport system substrate-binding protein